MSTSKNILRLITIQRILVGYRLDELLDKVPVLKSFKYFFILLPRKISKDSSLGERIRKALEELGPIFVKFGQVVSTRRDLLPEEIANELAKLQDQVTPFSKSQALEILDTAYDKSIDQIFKKIDDEPLAAASIAQVHSAKLSDGKDVIIKILRPNIQTQIVKDISALYIIARSLENFWSESEQVKPTEIVKEYEKTIINELDLKREAANAARLKKNFSKSEMLYVPEIYWDYCRTNILVQERIYGTPIRDIDTLKKQKTNIKALAENGVEIFFTQVFRHNFFHADMHPGNIFVQIEDPDFPKYAAVDFGIIGTLTKDDQYYLAENFLAFFEGDYNKIAQLHIDSGWVPSETRVDEFEIAIRTVCEPIFNKPLSDISFANVLISLFNTARQFNMEVQPQLILLQKTLFNIEGLGRQLYPELDLWKTAYPVLKVWMNEQIGFKSVASDFKKNLPLFRQTARDFPKIIKRFSSQAEIENKNRQNIAELKKQFIRQKEQFFFLAIGATLFMSGILVTLFSPNTTIGITLSTIAIIGFIKAWLK
ncbi:MAG: ubiquinone biosynthesis regulatory protein kinase UbiB [Woeseiaceae bacterium]|nr:ubiquinone biosynthesis regulatory protein kinase UbiB [Woeseiaceae bacterium]